MFGTQQRNPQDSTNRLYFGNIPFAFTQDDVRKIFEDCGEIKDVHIIMNRETNVSQGYGFITFATAESLPLALAKNRQLVEGRQLKVNHCSRQKPEGSGRIFVKNMPATVTEDSMKEVFEQNVGPVDKVIVIRDHETNKPRGFGFVDFNSPADVQKCLGLDGQELFPGAAPINLSIAKPKIPRNQMHQNGFRSRFNPYQQNQGGFGYGQQMSYGYGAQMQGYGAQMQAYGAPAYPNAYGQQPTSWGGRGAYGTQPRMQNATTNYGQAQMYQQYKPQNSGAGAQQQAQWNMPQKRY